MTTRSRRYHLKCKVEQRSKLVNIRGMKTFLRLQGTVQSMWNFTKAIYHFVKEYQVHAIFKVDVILMPKGIQFLWIYMNYYLTKLWYKWLKLIIVLWHWVKRVVAQTEGQEVFNTMEARFSWHRFSGKPRFKGHSSENLSDHFWFLVHKCTQNRAKLYLGDKSLVTDFSAKSSFHCISIFSVFLFRLLLPPFHQSN